MEFYDQVDLGDLVEGGEINMMIDSHLQEGNMDEENMDVGLLERLIFSDIERSYVELNSKASKQVIKAYSKLETSMQCENCNVIFSDEEFLQHACMYDELQQLNTVPGEEESELQKLQRRTVNLMKANTVKIREMTQTKAETDETIECSKCCRRFVHANGLYRHWDMHIGELLDESQPEDMTNCESVALCIFCGEVFGDSTKAWDHLVSHHVHVGNFSCQAAGSAVELTSQEPATDANNNVPAEPNQATPKQDNTRELQIAEFIRTINVSKLFQCEFCDSIFSHAKSMLFHASNHAPSAGFECKTCEIRDLNLKDFLLHRRDECINHRDVRNPLRDFPRIFVCNVCDEEFRGLEQLLDHRHEETHLFPRKDLRTDELSFMCERCIETFPNAPELIDHFDEKHKKKQKNSETAETSERVPKSASSRRGGSHQTSTRPRQYLCEVCGKSYTQSSHLWQHLRFHQGVKPFECTEPGCNRKFTIRPDLNDHIRKCHTGERPFLCTICGKRFLTGSVYYQHRLIHRGERRYGCEECGKRFYRADALKNHLRIHSGEKPHNCPVCHKTFRQRGDRDKHLKARHPDAEAVNSPKKKRVKSFGRGRVKNNTSLYRSKPEGGPE